MKCAAVGVLLCSSFLWAGSAPEPSETLVITNVNVVDTRHGGIEPNVNVIVKDGVITAISKFALVNAGPHDRVINAEGRYLIPGLWVLHARLVRDATSKGRSPLALYLVNGVTGLLDPDGVEEKCAATQPDWPSPEIAKPGPTLHAELGAVEYEAIGGVNQADVAASPGTWLHLELQALVRGGLTPLQALQAVTYNAALYMAKLDKYGVIERAHIADVVLLEKNPLDDIRNSREIAAVVLRGTYFSRADPDAVRARAQQEADQSLNAAKGPDLKSTNAKVEELKATQ